jgi:hypothetical protein
MKYAIVKDGVVVNVIEYEEQPSTPPAGFEEGMWLFKRIGLVRAGYMPTVNLQTQAHPQLLKFQHPSH